MLKALLRRKLGRVAKSAEDDPESEADDEAEDVASDSLTGLEDPLTATIFERVAYLPPELAWRILRRSSKPLDGGPELPASPPPEAPVWSFWPGLRPADLGRNKNRVEPDVLVSWGQTLLVIEAKHRGTHDPAQWLEQIRAIHAAPDSMGKHIWFLAIGGIVAKEVHHHAAHVRNELADELPGLLALRWEELREELDSLDHSLHSCGTSQVLRDMVFALETWGYRRKVWFSSLPAAASLPPTDDAIAVLQSWRVR